MRSKRTLRRAVIGITTTVALLATAACSAPESADSKTGAGGGGPTHKLSLSSPYADNVSAAAAYKAFSDGVVQDSEGRVEVETYWAGALFPYPEALKAVGSGLADVSPLAVPYSPHELSLSNWATPLASYAEDPSFFASMLTGSVATLSMMKDPLFQAEADAAGVVVIGVFVSDPSVLLCSQPVESAADAAGIVARGSGTAELESMNMTPSSIPFSEAYEALQREIIDCTVNPVGTAADLGLFEVAPHIVEVPMSGSVNWLAINKGKYEALSEDQQKIIRAAGLIYMREAMLAQIGSAAKALAEGGAAADAVISRPNGLVEALTSRQRERIESLKDAPPAGMAKDDAARILETYKDDVRRLTGLLRESGFDTADGATLRDTAVRAASPASTDAIKAYFDSLRNEVVG